MSLVGEEIVWQNALSTSRHWYRQIECPDKAGRVGWVFQPTEGFASGLFESIRTRSL